MDRLSPSEGESSRSNTGDAAWEQFSASSDDQRAARELFLASQEGAEVPRAKGIWVRDIRFNSIQEAACALCLERYIPAYRIQHEDTYEITIWDKARGTRKSIDFRVGNTFVEYHPPVVWENNGSRQKPRLLTGASAKQEVERYTQERRRLIDGEKQYQKHKLIVATSPEDFYQKVIARFAIDPPSKPQFMEHFNALCKLIQKKE